jgi:hypothetical protein
MYDMHKKAIEKREIIDYLILELGFELRVSHLLGSHFTTSAILPFFLVLIIFLYGLRLFSHTDLILQAFYLHLPPNWYYKCEPP